MMDVLPGWACPRCGAFVRGGDEHHHDPDLAPPAPEGVGQPQFLPPPTAPSVPVPGPAPILPVGPEDHPGA